MGALFRNCPRVTIINCRFLRTSSFVHAPRRVKPQHNETAMEGYDNTDGSLHPNIQSSNPIVQKYSSIINELRKSHAIQNNDCVYSTSFGHVRLDKDNRPPEDRFSESFQLGNSTDRVQTTPPSVESANFIDDVYFSSSAVPVNDSVSLKNASRLQEDINKEDLGFIDEVTFKQPPPPPPSEDYSTHPVSKADVDKDQDLNAIDEIYFKTQYSEKGSPSNSEYSPVDQDSPVSDFEREITLEDDLQTKKIELKPQFDIGSHTKRFEEEFKQSYVSRLEELSKSKPKKRRTITNVSVPIDDQNTVSVKQESAKVAEKPQVEDDSALAYARKLRREERAKSLSDGKTNEFKDLPISKRIIAMLPRYDRMIDYDIEVMLRKAIVYDEADILAINKPYGMRIHDGGDSRSNVLTLTELLPKLCRIVGAEKLHMIHRLDMNTTGILLMAKSEQRASELRQMFKNNTVIKTYLTITKGTPQIKQGLIDIPIRESATDGKLRMNLQPVTDGNNRERGRAIKATTKYKVLSSCFSTSLLSVTPLTGVKHQIRAHLGLGLGCPVLADHKYSNLNKIVPQKLSSDTLERFKLKQSRVRDLPIMLHSSSVFFPQILDGKNLKISCIPPSSFRLTMKTLKLTSSRSVLDMKNIETVDLGADII